MTSALAPARGFTKAPFSVGANPDYDGHLALGARAPKEPGLWGAETGTLERQPVHINPRRPDSIAECGASDAALTGIVVRAPQGVAAGGRFWRRLGATEAPWSSCLREMPRASRLPLHRRGTRRHRILTWIRESRVAGGKEMTFGRSLQRHLEHFGLPAVFTE